ncbi:MAG: n-acetylglutamate synthase [Bacteroidota bacterium]
MKPIHYHDRRFRAIHTAENGEVRGDTLFHYRQQGETVWGTYEGGGIRLGTLIATVGDAGHLDMRYAHVNADGDLRTGTCQSTPEVLSDGRIRLHERWQWTSGDHSSGESIVEEVRLERYN